MTLNVPYPAFSAGAAIVATQMNSNFSVIQNYINTQVLGAAGGTISGAVTVSNNLSVTGVASLGASNQVYISPTEEVTGLAAGTDITTNDAASFLNARNYPVGLRWLKKTGCRAHFLRWPHHDGRLLVRQQHFREFLHSA